ncbi:T9SS type A sorting domain-containing protein [Tenacibaculum insulae]|uniref:T9SS type A sorting domain-containing protein n=1 Tax=Tenacibaculum insulae TaxID=2029677 RepID=UPI003AB62156
MKKLLLFLVVISSQLCFSQNVPISDANFEQALIDQNIDSDGTLNGLINREDINSLLNLTIQNIPLTDLTILRHFDDLENLTLVNCSLTSIDLSDNDKLKRLTLPDNNLSSVDLSNNSNLQNVSLQNNVITSIDVSNITPLEILLLFNNNLTTLDVSANQNLSALQINNNALIALNVRNGKINLNPIINNNPNLSCITVDDSAHSTANWNNKDAHHYFSETCSQTYVPDDNFEQALIDLGYDYALDDYVYTENINTITTLDVSNKSILNTTGIEAFVALETLDMNTNFFSQAINFSAFTQLKTLDISNNASYGLSGETIDITGCILLESINISGNGMSNLNISNNTNLEHFTAGNNNLSVLNLSTHVNLIEIVINNNDLAILNVKNGNNNNVTNFNATENPGLVCIEVDNEAYSTTNWTNIDAASTFTETSCELTYIPDDNFEQALIDLGIVSNTVIDDYVLTSEIETVESLIIGARSISNLTGIEDFAALKDFNIGNSNVSTIDMSSNLALQSLQCNGNPLTSLNISQNNALTLLRANQTSLSEIDASNNTALTSINVSNCPNLTQLNIQNGNNTNMSGGNFSANNNPNLFCIQVDTAAYSTTNWTTIDAQTFFNTNSCEVTYVPDDGFEQKLIDLGHDDVLNNYVTTSHVSNLTSIDLRFQNIVDMTGIEDFTALVTLQCQVNNITTIDISNNTNLRTVYCDRNNITTLDVSTLTDLQLLRAYDNNLAALDVSSNLLLDNLNVTNNPISNLNVSNNTQLINFEASNTALEDLDLSSNTLLTKVIANNNANLASLNIKNGENTNILTANFDSTNTPNLTCIQVDDVTYSTANWTAIDMQTSFNENCYYGLTYVPDDAFEQTLINYGLDDVLDDYVVTSNIDTMPFFGFNNTTISDVTGLEDFIALQELNITNNPNITAINVTTLTQLIELNLSDNQLTSIDVSNNLLLERLRLRNNNLTSLDISNNTAITSLQLSGNTISTIDTTPLNQLRFFTCSRNPITSLNLSNNPDLDYISASETNITNIDFSNNPLLDEVYLRDNSISTLDFSNNPTLKYLFASSSAIGSINLGTANALLKLELDDNNLNALDVSTAIALVELNVADNNLTELDVFNSEDLNILNAANNSILSLDLSNNKDGGLSEVIVNNNALESFNIKGGDNSEVTVFNALNNPSLTCIQVDDAAYSTTNWTNIDAQTSFNEFCPEFYTYVPDDNFEQALIDLGHDDVLDDYVLTSNINTLTSLNVFFKGIADATGIEDFVALTYLNIRQNALTSIDLSNNTQLTIINISYNNLTNIDVSTNIQLEVLYAQDNTINTIDFTNNAQLRAIKLNDNNLTSIDVTNLSVLNELSISRNTINTLDVSSNLSLWNLYAEECGLSTIDLSNNNLLEELYINNNTLTALSISNMPNLIEFQAADNMLSNVDLSNNLELESVWLSNNTITTIDASANTNLNYLIVENNNLESLNVKNGNNIDMHNMHATGNPNLSCIEVDDENGAYLTATGGGNILKWQKDAGASFSENCGNISSINWTGNTNSSWLTGSNWSGSAAPIITDNVIIPNVATAPEVSSVVQINNLTVEALSSFDISEDGSLTTDRDFTNSGTFKITSTALNSGSLLVKGTSNGTVTYERGGLLASKWSIVSAPVDGQSIKEFVENVNNNIRVNTTTSPNRYAVSYYDDSKPSGSKWIYYDVAYLAANPNITFEKGRSYAISRGTDGTVSFTGTVTINNISKTVVASEWNAIGNPYTAFLPINENGGTNFINENSSKLDPANVGVYVWDNQQDKYVGKSLITSEASLAPGQGFFIKTSTGISDVIFNESQRKNQPITGGVFARGITVNKPSIQLSATSKNTTITTVIKYFENATIGLDPGYDLGNFGRQDFDIYTKLVDTENKGDFTIQSLPINNIETTIIPLGLKISEGEEVTFTATLKDLSAGVSVFIEDKKLQTFTKLNASTNDVYTVNITEKVNETGRFYLHAKQSIIPNEIKHIDEVKVYTNESKNLIIDGISEGDFTIKLYTINGQLLLNKTIEAKGKNTMPLLDIETGIYIVNVGSELGSKTQKIILKK